MAAFNEILQYCFLRGVSVNATVRFAQSGYGGEIGSSGCKGDFDND